jgi:phosphatidyl-myo-inositol dimannoside synthase
MTFDPPEGSGGIEGRTMAYTAGLKGRGIHVEVAALSPGQKRTEEDYQGTRLVRLSSSFMQLPRTFGALVSMICHSSLDSIFILSGGSTPAGALVLGFARFAGRKSGVFFYGRDILQASRKPGGRIALALSVLLAQGVAANSKFTASLLPLAPKRPLTIIYPGVDIGITNGLDPERNLNPPRLLFVGRLVKRKGADLLLEAFSQLRTDLPDLRLDIVGDGPELENLRALANSLGLTDAVTFWGALYGEELWRRYARASLLVLPSRQSKYDVEGFGTVFLEAAAFRVPSVGTLTGGIPEAVIDGVSGRLVESDDVDGLRSAIGFLLKNPDEMERFGKNARDRALRLTWNDSTAKVLTLLGHGGD